MTRHEEIEAKHERVRQYLESRGLEGLLLTRISNFAWLTAGGDNHLGLATEAGAASLLVTREKRTLLCEKSEAARLPAEELDGLGFDVRDRPWQERSLAQAVLELVSEMRLASDLVFPGPTYLSHELAELRTPLLPPEVERYREGAQRAAGALAATLREAKPGMTEREVAGRLAGRLMAEGLTLTHILAGSDDRAQQYPHPTPTARPVERILALSAGARWKGLVTSLSRAVSFGPVPDGVAARHRAAATVAARLFHATRSGAPLSDLWRGVMGDFKDAGYPDGWRAQEVGGPTGYEPREFSLAPFRDETVRDSQAFVWSPWMEGARSEDTCLAGPEDAELLSTTPNWPTILAPAGGREMPRPDILVLEG